MCFDLSHVSLVAQRFLILNVYLLLH
ncbi:unnamed protein product [Nezara viridula]|uniref:Uncharacterized protein n=1 Tax=Nezara viridula TaxID=85310 RepID=A0A9P0E187_NEZVI|nr:unnamed protein product [Nezara viridula]